MTRVNVRTVVQMRLGSVQHQGNAAHETGPAESCAGHGVLADLLATSQTREVVQRPLELLDHLFLF